MENNNRKTLKVCGVIALVVGIFFMPFLMHGEVALRVVCGAGIAALMTAYARTAPRSIGQYASSMVPMLLGLAVGSAVTTWVDHGGFHLFALKALSYAAGVLIVSLGTKFPRKDPLISGW